MKFARRCFNHLLHTLARSLPGSTSLRPFLHRLRGVSIGRNVFIGDDVYLENKYPENIEIQYGVQITLKSIIIAHIRGPGKIVFEENSYIGAGSIIVCGPGQTLRIGKGAVVAAGSVITTNVAPGTLVKAEPPRVIADVTKPLPECNSFNEFLFGLRPHTRK